MFARDELLKDSESCIVDVRTDGETRACLLLGSKRPYLYKGCASATMSCQKIE
ncbi:MAG: hypothetical protein IPJ49_23830 [Candidatus Obscuribacter sp.]|nr:hypothetical protein [Candidatus Obscuribacter sp.]